MSEVSELSVLMTRELIWRVLNITDSKSKIFITRCSRWLELWKCWHLLDVHLSAGTLTSFTAGFVKIRWNVWSELVIGVITALQAALLLLMLTTDNIWVCYTAYVLFRGFYQFLVPIATWVPDKIFYLLSYCGTTEATFYDLWNQSVQYIFLDVGSVLIIFLPLRSFQIASSLTKELCALVFGINTFLGTILKTIINLIFADKRGLALDVKSQVETAS